MDIPTFESAWTGRLGSFPHLLTQVPGPLSLQMSGELRRWESPNITYVDEQFPVFWEAASSAIVQDVDGNTFLDLAAAFGVAGVGHCHPAVVAAIQQQAGRLIHGMGDVHPPALKVELARRLAQIAPGDLQQVIFGCTGSDAVEAALKSAVMATGKPGVVAFHGAYHGLGYGAMQLAGREYFRKPFQSQMSGFVTHAPYPGGPHRAMDSTATAGQSLDGVEAALRRGLSPGGTPVGAVIAEPIQGRAGIIVPPRGWFAALADLTRRYGALLIADEIFTGMGRTGEWFASEVTPDLLCLGKVLGGGFPISACIGTPAVMAAWGESTGEAIHTSTFLGSPLGCAAGLAVIEVIHNEHLIERCRALGAWLHGKLTDLAHRETRVRDVRGRGLMLGLEVCHRNGAAAPGVGARIMKEALQRGVIVLPAGPRGDVVELTPPYVLSAEQATFALDVLEKALSAAGAGSPAADRDSFSDQPR